MVVFLSPDSSSLSPLAAAVENTGWRVCTASSPDRPREAIPWKHACCAVAELRANGPSGVALLGSIRQRHPFVPVIFLAARPSVSRVVESMKAGAFDFLELPVEADGLTSRVDEAARQFRNDLPGFLERQRVDELLSTLTKRELQLLSHVVEGLTTKEIAFELGIREVTVDFHRRNLYRKMEAENAVLLTRLMENHRHARLRSPA